VKKTGKHVKVKVKKAAVRKPAPKKVARRAAPKRKPSAIAFGAAARAAVQPKPVDATGAEVVPTGAHLDAPSAVAHPGAGHQSVVRSEVKP
jgi:hypothetical protein